MGLKLYKMRSLTMDKGKTAFIDLNLEFEGNRAFVVWDSVTLGEYLLKARVEIDPTLLQEDPEPDCDFVYRGQLILPRPENN
jgi:hypothetical protein